MGEFFALILFGTVGMLLMTSAVELLLVFIGLEISSISTYILAGFRKRSGKSPEAAIKYFLLGSFATAFFLYGIALTFGATGTTRISAIAAALPHSATPILAWTAVGLILVGLGFKVSAAPFHVWTPDVYEGAPSPVVALMSTAPKAAAFAVLLRIFYGAYPSIQQHWWGLFWILAAVSMTLGNLAALRQQSVKRMLAYSSIAHAGYLLVAFTAFSPAGVAAAAFYALCYVAMNVGIFAVISHVGGYDDHLWSITDYRGLGYRSPVLAGAMAFFLLSLIGIPFTGGFFAKFYVFSAALQSGMFALAIIGLVNSGIAAFYYLRLLVALYSKPAEGSPVLSVPRMSLTLGFAILLAASATLLLGIVPRSSLDLAQRGAATFFAPALPAQAAAPSTLAEGPVTVKNRRIQLELSDLRSLALQPQVPLLKDPHCRFKQRAAQQHRLQQARTKDQACMLRNRPAQQNLQQPRLRNLPARRQQQRQAEHSQAQDAGNHPRQHQ